MKKLLIATTALTLVAGAASADVTLAGSGYFGMKYDGSNTSTTGSAKKTQLIDRFQIDIKASKTNDSGLTFHGKFRIRSNAGQTGPVIQNNNATNPLITDANGNKYVLSGTTTVNAGQVGVTAGGLDVSVGNVSDAIDALTLYWNSEIGLCGCGGETLQNGIVGYSSTGGGNNGLLVTYTMGDLVVRGGYQQTGGQVNGAKNEASASVAYKMGALSFELGYLNQQGSGNASTAVVEYALGNSNIGLAYGHNSYDAYGNIVTLYGNTTFGATTVQAFVSQSSKLPSVGGTKTTYGVGASYDLGSGAAIVGSVRQQYSKKAYADLGVKFAF